MLEAHTFNRDHVEAGVHVRQTAIGEPHRRGIAKALLLSFVNGRRCPAVSRAAASFDFTEHDQIQPPSDQIDLGRQAIATTNPVASNDLKTESAEMKRGAILAPAASGPPGLIDTQKSRFSRILAALPTRSRR